MNNDNLHLDTVTINMVACTVHRYSHGARCAIVERCVYKTMQVAEYKHSSEDEIANVNHFTTISHTYFKISDKRTYFVLQIKRHI